MARSLALILVLSISSTGCWRILLVAAPFKMTELAYRRFPPARRCRSSRTRTRSSASTRSRVSVPRPSPPPAQRETKLAGRPLYNAGLRCFEKFDYPTALTHFAGAITAGDMDKSKTATCHFYRGAIFVILERRNKAIEEFQKCISMCPDYSPSCEIFRPDVIALYKACGKG